MFSVIILDFDGFLDFIMHTVWCFYIFLFVLTLEKVWKFGLLVFFARVNFREFVLAKSLTGINFRKITKILQNS